MRRGDLSFSTITLAALWRRALGKNKWDQGEESENYKNNPGRKGRGFGSGDEETQTSSSVLLAVELTGLDKD